KAKGIRLWSLEAPHMRSFHLSWLGFFIAFTGWFAYAPLLKKTVGPNLGMTASDIANSDTANVSSTVIFRVITGILVDKLGASKVMGIILILGSIPLGLSALSTTATGIIVSRAFIGMLGSTFVPCQYWTTAFFSSNVVGTANAIAGGWGNMGGGFTNLVMPRVYNLFHFTFGLPIGTSWRAAICIPVAFLWIVAALVLYFGVDKPGSEFKLADTTHVDQVEQVTWKTAFKTKRSLALFTFNVALLMFNYACCFGVELSIDGALASYYVTQFQMDQNTSSLLGGLFGMINLFSRASGGLMSDYMSSKMGMRGRLYWQCFLFIISAATIMAFSQTYHLGGSIALLILFSFTVQAGCGSTYGIVPFVGPLMGLQSGLVGAGGSIGGALF
ncbi:major facilitator superfamily domain-containing protein, partial [Chytriomyces sp. MP71]